MTRLIDADKFKDSMKYVCDSGGWLEPVTTAVKDYVVKNIDAQPTVDAESVRHGKWYVWYDTEDGRMLRCSECKMVFWVGSGREGNYCPNCGAKMDKQEEQNGS